MNPACCRRWLPAAILAPVVLMMTVGVLMVRARAAGSRGTAALSRGAPAEAVIEFERALGFYIPLDPAFQKSIEGMRAAAAGQERSGDLVGAWRTSERLQAAIRETASILPSDEGLLGELESDQRRLEARLAASGNPVRGPSGPAAVSVEPVRSSLVILLLGVWVTCGFMLSARIGSGKPLLPWATAFLAAWVTWAASLWLA